jgi:uncharacterized protein (TIGR02246 family)
MRERFEDTIENFLERFRESWDSGDAHAFAALFTETATYVTWLGDLLAGRLAIESTHDDVFKRWSTPTKVSIKVIETKPLCEDVCVVLTAGGIGEQKPISHDKLQTFVLVRSGTYWFCAAFQNTGMSERARNAFN